MLAKRYYKGHTLALLHCRMSPPRPSAYSAPATEPYTVSALVRTLKDTMEATFTAVWLEGELSNFRCPSSGHWYFTLKDAHAQLQCVMFRGNNLRVRPTPLEGDQLRVRGRISVYQNRGQLQLICDQMEPAGSGALLREFERLKKKLEAEGLFDPASRRPLPARPAIIGVITSGTGAALQDILDTLCRRWPLAQVYLWPVPVQGAAAAPAIVKALSGLPTRATPDCIILARGGGSLEDLWAFNEESVARAIRACTVPVITGVGHETDTTIADFAADLRAPTPTAAAERATPDAAELLLYVDKLRYSLVQYMQREHRFSDEAVKTLARRLRLQHPRRALQDDMQTADALSLRLDRSMKLQLRQQRQRLSHNLQRFRHQHPRRVVGEHEQNLNRLEKTLMTHCRHSQQRRRERLDRAGRLLQTLGPAAVLKRGFAWVSKNTGHPLRSTAEVAVGDRLQVRLYRGSLQAEVQSKVETPDD